MSKTQSPKITKTSPAWQETLAERIKLARQEMHVSQKALGEMLHLSDKAVSAYEVGRAVPTIETLVLLSDLCYKPIGYFFEQRTADLELQIKLKQIEKELLQAKQAVEKRQLPRGR
jgi:transcriptional regulator with XRE-family HTH domain